MDFRPVLTSTPNILPLSVVTADKGYDSEDNHLLIREELHVFSIIPARNEHVSIWRTLAAPLDLAFNKLLMLPNCILLHIYTQKRQIVTFLLLNSYI
jgi:hypothetical protein